MPPQFSIPSPRTADTYEAILVDALLAQHGGRNRLRLLGDEELHRARLAIWREQVTADEWFADIPDPVLATSRVLALGLARQAIEEEEGRRERARIAHLIPRDPARGWVPEAVIDAIRARLSPVEVFHRYGLTELREQKNGKWTGACPFHADDSPSLYVYTADPQDMHWHCFGCMKHGDVFDIARLHFGLPFKEVCEGLAGIAGIQWEQTAPRPPARPKPAARKSTRVVVSGARRGD